MIIKSSNNFMHSEKFIFLLFQYIHHISIFTFALLVLSCTSCSFLDTKENYLEKFEVFIGNIEVYGVTYTEDEWNEVQIEFENYSIVLYSKFKNELTSLEIRKVDKLNSRYEVVILKYKINKVIDSILNTIDEVTGAASEILMHN